MRRMVVLVCMVLALLVLGCAPTGPQPPTPTEPGAKEGRAVFVITDAAANMSAVSSVKVTVDSVRVHSAAEGWVTVSSTPKTYDLLQLKAEGSNAILADAQLKEGTYQQLRLDISKVIVTDASGEHEAKLPSGELKTAGVLVVKADSTATATFDFIADESLHTTSKGEYIMAPVIQLETREDATVEVKAGNKAEIVGGNVKTNVKVGMDIAGNVGVGLKIGLDEELMIENGIVKVGGKGRAVLGITDAAADMGTVTSVKVTVDSVRVHSVAEGWVTVSNVSKTYDLIELNATATTALLADAQLKEGTYQQLRLDISTVEVVDANGTHEAKLPSGELKIVGQLAVAADSTSTATFDFVASESLHKTGKGEYILAPVVKLETREDAEVEITADKKITIKNGTVKTKVKVGMDISGNVGADKRVAADDDLAIENGTVMAKGKVKTKASANVTLS